MINPEQMGQQTQPGSNRGRIVIFPGAYNARRPAIEPQSETQPGQVNLLTSLDLYIQARSTEYRATWNGQTVVTPAQVAADERRRLLRGETDFIG